MTIDLSHIDGCAFDAYGTLFDLGSAVAGASASLGDKAGELNALWRLKQIEYTWLRSLMGRYTDFETVTREALRHSLDALKITDQMLENRLMETYYTLNAYDDARQALADLKAKHYWCAVLSNGSPRMLNSGVEAAGLNDHLDAVLSVDSVGVFKPDPKTYRMGTIAAGVEARRILFVSSNPWDVNGASTFGYTTAWINRMGLVPENLPGGADVEIRSLAELPPLLNGSKD